MLLLLVERILYTSQLLLKLRMIFKHGWGHGSFNYSFHHLFVALDFKLLVCLFWNLKSHFSLNFYEQLFSFIFIQATLSIVQISICLHHTLYAGQVVLEHNTINRMVLLRFQLMHTQYCKFKSLTTHNTFKDVHCNFDKFNLIDENPFLLCSVHHAHILPNCNFLWLLRIP